MTTRGPGPSVSACVPRRAARIERPSELALDFRSLLTSQQAIRPVGALHCTLGVMSLNNEQLSQATALLEGLDVPSLLSKVAEDEPLRPLVINLKGLESMHAPEKTSILYAAPADPSERLYSFCLAVQELFKDQGLLVEDDRKLKLHATIVNTIYAKGKKMPANRHAATPAGKPSFDQSASTASGSSLTPQDDGSIQGHGPNANAPLKIDARTLLDQYKDFVWADNIALDRLAICEMGAKKVTDADGKVIAEQYTEVASIALPA